MVGRDLITGVADKINRRLVPYSSNAGAVDIRKIIQNGSVRALIAVTGGYKRA